MDAEVSGLAEWRRARIVVTLPAPAVGTDWQLVIPGGHIYCIESVQATLVTSATAGNREVDLTFGDGDTNFLALQPSATQAASLTRLYTWYPWANGQVIGNNLTQPIPYLTLLPGSTMGPVTALLAGGDQWSTVKVYVVDTTVRGGRVNIESAPDLFIAMLTGGR